MEYVKVKAAKAKSDAILWSKTIQVGSSKFKIEGSIIGAEISTGHIMLLVKDKYIQLKWKDYKNYDKCVAWVNKQKKIKVINLI
jgi:hypothetical protein